ncbi:MAG: hypothetical protein M1825_003218 [Sarcosagium campestre]|nr:MAG: hypothetical protein M1825_003218 [Sarcosagium campestre]
MGFFDHLQAKGATTIKPQSTIRRTIVTTGASQSSNKAKRTAPPVHERAVPMANNDRGLKPRNANGPKPTRPKSPSADTPSARAQMPKKRRVAAVQQRLSSSSDDSDESIDFTVAKRAKTTSTAKSHEDLNRQVRSATALPSTASAGDFPFVHAADIASADKSNKFTPAFQDDVDQMALRLQYPGGGPGERYELVRPKDGEDMDPLRDIVEVVEIVSKYYLTESQAKPFLDENDGIHRKLRRAVARGSGDEFRREVEGYNEAIVALRDEGIISENLDKMHSIPLPLVERILTQAYSRTVSLKVDSLKKYENGTDNVYGELLPRLISKIFQETDIRSDHVFVDLGSGVGNVVLQAALEIGCESWGCEMMDNACDLAELQQAEFEARCRLWGIRAGSSHLVRGDFVMSPEIGKVLQRADVLLVNNQAFTPSLNMSLMNMFLDLKEGCRIVSLKSFVPHDHKITARNLNSPVNLLEVETKPYYSNCVSWTNAPGSYCIAKKDSRKLRAFAKRLG